MPQLVEVSSVENREKLKVFITELFARDRFAEITQAIGMHAILIDPEHMLRDQNDLYRMVLNLLKERIIREHGQLYSSWLTAFPSLLSGLVRACTIVTDQTAQIALASRHAAFGRFSSIDEFYFWALDDRRLTLEQIIAYVRKTIEMHKP
jgi:hypothetical protein